MKTWFNVTGSLGLSFMALGAIQDIVPEFLRLPNNDTVDYT